MEQVIQLNQYIELEQENFFNKYYKTGEYVIKNILQGIGTKEDIEDCVHDTLAEIMMNQEKYDTSRGSIETYIRVVARSKALYARKKLSHQLTVPLEDQIIIHCDDEVETKEIIRTLLE